MDNRAKFNIFADTMKVNLDTGVPVEPKICPSEVFGNNTVEVSSVGKAVESILIKNRYDCEAIFTEDESAEKERFEVANEIIKTIETLELGDYKKEILSDWSGIDPMPDKDFESNRVRKKTVMVDFQQSEQPYKYPTYSVKDVRPWVPIDLPYPTPYEQMNQLAEAVRDEHRSVELTSKFNPSAFHKVNIEALITSVISIGAIFEPTHNGVCSKCGSEGDHMFTSFYCTNPGCQNFKE